MSDKPRAYPVGQHPDLPPPSSEIGVIHWVRTQLFSSLTSSVLTLVSLLFIVWTVPPAIDWVFLSANWTSRTPQECPPAAVGACWGFVGERFYQYLFGFYPRAEMWRPILSFGLMMIAIVPLLFASVPYRSAWLIVSALSPVVILTLLSGGAGLLPGIPFLSEGGVSTQILRFAFYLAVFWPAVTGIQALVRSKRIANTAFGQALPFLPVFAVLILLAAGGLEPVPTSNWGGFLLSLVVGVSGIVASLPLGILLALGRRSDLPIIRAVCVFMIEVPRGVPLITLLFMASVMLPLFAPEGVSFDKLLRALVVVALFASAYMAEVIRGGLQAIPKGQEEAAAALGLGYWQSTSLIVLPQALRIVIPGIVNTFIGLFKDTTLVSIIGLLDLLGVANVALQDPDWLARPGGLFIEAYLFVAFIFWIFTFGMSRYSAWLEEQLSTGNAGVKRGAAP